MRTLPVLDCCTSIGQSTLSVDEAAELERLFKSLADRNRLRILNVLVNAGDEAVCVCELQPLLEVGQPTVSHHLKQLVEAGLLQRERRGTYAYYRLEPGALDRIGALLSQPTASAV